MARKRMTNGLVPGRWRLLVGWLSAPIGAFIAYCIADQGYDAGRPASGMFVVLAGLFACGMSAFLVGRRLLLAESGRAERLLQAGETAELGALLRERQSEPGALYRVLRGAYHQWRVDAGSMDTEPLFHAAEHRLLMTVERVKLTAGLLPFGGLVGTMLGIGWMCGQMAQAMATGTPGPETVAALFGPQGALAGMGAAVSTTIVGAVLGKILDVLAFDHVQAVAAMMTSWREDVANYVACDMRRAGRLADAPNRPEVFDDIPKGRLAWQ